MVGGSLISRSTLAVALFRKQTTSRGYETGTPGTSASDEAERLIFRTAQEALRNVRDHAAATTCHLFAYAAAEQTGNTNVRADTLAA